MTSDFPAAGAGTGLGPEHAAEPPSAKPRGRTSPRRRLSPTSGERGFARRDEIMQAAIETFFEKGYEATTTQDIADAVGILKGSLYYYITSKEELLYEVLLHVHARWMEGVRYSYLCRVDGDPLTKIWAFVYNNVIRHTDDLVGAAVFFQGFDALGRDYRRKIVKLRDNQDSVLRRFIEEGKRDKSIREDVDVTLCANGVLSMCSSVYRWYRMDGRSAPYELACAFANMAVSGLASDATELAPARERALASRTFSLIQDDLLSDQPLADPHGE